MNKRKEKKNKWINGDKINNNNIAYNNETKYKEIQMNNNKDINNDHDNDNNNRKGFNKQLQKNTRLIFENVAKQSRFKNPSRSITLPLSYYYHYIRSLL